MLGAGKAHPEEEILERFALGRLDEPELGEFEEHLLICGSCQQRLDEATEYVKLMRDAAATVATQAPAESKWSQWFRWNWLPAQALAGGLAVLAVALLWQPWEAQRPVDWRTIELESLRGPANEAASVEGFGLIVRLDITGLDTSGASAQIVRADGTQVAELPLEQAAGKAELRYAPGLEAGQYWIRLRKDGETAREYALTIKSRGV